MAGNDGTDDGRFVGCSHCTDNIAGICGHCSGDHHGPDCPTLRGIQPFTPEELEGIQERLSVTPGVIARTGGPDEAGDLIAILVRDYRAIQNAMMGGIGHIADWQPEDFGAALGILKILYDNRGNQ